MGLFQPPGASVQSGFLFFLALSWNWFQSCLSELQWLVKMLSDTSSAKNWAESNGLFLIQHQVMEASDSMVRPEGRRGAPMLPSVVLLSELTTKPNVSHRGRPQPPSCKHRALESSKLVAEHGPQGGPSLAKPRCFRLSEHTEGHPGDVTSSVLAQPGLEWKRGWVCGHLPHRFRGSRPSSTI